MSIWSWLKHPCNPWGHVEAQPMNGQQEKMLLVGINQYACGQNLAGCVNDVMDVKAFMIQFFGWDAANIHMLLDAAASTANIKSELQWLADVATGARQYYHNSSHGAQAPINGVLCDVMCPSDFNWDLDKMVTDKDYLSIFGKIPAGCHFNWVSDSCHSGDLDRTIRPTHIKLKRLLPPQHIANAILELKKAHIIKNNAVLQSRAITSGLLDVGFISGCKSDQTSADTQVSGRPCGACTNAYLRILLQNLKATVQQIATNMDNDLAQNGYEQLPQASGARIALPMFG